MTFVLNNQGTKILELEETATNFDFGYSYLKSIKKFQKCVQNKYRFLYTFVSYRVEFLQCLKY